MLLAFGRNSFVSTARGLQKLYGNETGMPAVDLGVKITKSALALSRAIHSGAMPKPAAGTTAGATAGTTAGATASAASA